MQLPPRYSDGDVALIFSPLMSLARRVQIWSVVAGQLQLDDPSRDCAFDIRSIDLESLTEDASTLETKYGHDVAAQCEALRLQLSGGAQRYLHYGLCSSDISDTDLSLAIRATTHVLDEKALTFRQALAANPWNSLDIRADRTHGQIARIGSTTQQAAVWRQRVLTARDALQAALTDWPGGFEGPTGHGAHFGRKVSTGIRRELGLQREVADPAFNRAWVSRWLQAVCGLIGAAEHFALQVRLGAQSGIDELREPSGVSAYRGSSARPHKNNPTRSERICGLATVARALSGAHAEASSTWWGQHSLEHSSVERVVVPQVASLAGYVLTEATAIAAGLQVDVEQCKTNARGLGDSYRERNRLIDQGLDGNQAWLSAKEAKA